MLRARTPSARVRELLKVIGNDCRRGRAFFYRSLNFTIMSDTKQPFYKSKAFWTLVSSIVAALAAFSLPRVRLKLGCSVVAFTSTQFVLITSFVLTI